jgi:zinc D-Ala-D-Ala carboxypeptidase
MTRGRWVPATVLLAVLAGCGSQPAPSASLAASPTPTARAVAPVGVERLAGHAAPRATQPEIAPRYQAALVADHCVDRDVLAPAATDITLTLVDRTYAIPRDYVPPDLVPAAEAGFDGSSGDRLVRAVLVEDLAAMRRASEAAHLTIVIESAYRSAASQAATFDSWVARLGLAAAALRTARPGHSEHQLGTAIDVTSPGWSGRIGDWAAETAEGAWMAAHAWEYGFVMSFPRDATPDTCFGYEPWHYRWVGREVAAQQHASGLALRTFLERYATG